MAEQHPPPTSSSSRAGVRIAVVHGAGGYALGVARGVLRFVSQRSLWEVEVGDALPNPGYLRKRGIRGVIAQMLDVTHADGYRALGLTAVNVADNHGDRSLPTVISNNRAVGALAAEHLLSRNLYDFAFYGQNARWYAKERCAGFERRMREAGHKKVHTLFFSGDDGDETELTRWLRSLPRPIGVMAENDVRALALMRACAAAGLDVPRDVAVIGVDNDLGICETYRVPLSSVAVNAERIGYEAAALLERLLQGEPAPVAPIEISPIGVEPRKSTECAAGQDRLIAEAMQIIGANLEHALEVDELAERLGISRRHLDRRFHQAMGRTVAEELRRQRIECAKFLLRETNQKVIEVALRSGFTGASQFNVAFRQATRMAPGDYRRQVQSRANREY